MSRADLGHRLAHLYALISGVAGLVVLTRFFVRQAPPADLAFLLAFTLTALIVSYFGVPVGRAGTQKLGLEGAVLLGTTLAGGPALGGWAAFITGMITGIIPFPSTSTVRWEDNVSTALLNSGRNVIAIALAWWAYQGLGGESAPTVLDTSQTLAILALCGTYATTRRLWLQPARALRQQGRPSRDDLEDVLIELVPLPISVLIAATFVELGWSFYLLLAFTFIGLGSIMRQMIEHIRAMQEQIQELEVANHIGRSIASTPPDIRALSELTYQLCQQIVSVPKFELGFYDSTQTHVHIQVSVDHDTRLPPMHIPLTPMWEWLGERSEPQLIQGQAQLALLPFSLPEIGQELTPQAAMFIPILGTLERNSEDKTATMPPQVAIGGIVIQSPQVDTFSEHDVPLVNTLAQQAGAAIEKSRPAS